MGVTKKEKPKKNKLAERASQVVILILLLSGAILLAYHLVFLDRIYPGVTISGIPVSGLKPAEAEALLAKNITKPTSVTLYSGEDTFNLDLEKLTFRYDYTNSITQAYTVGRTGNFAYDILRKTLALLGKKSAFGLQIKINEEDLEKELLTISDQISVYPKNPFATIEGGKIFIENGGKGSVVDIQNLRISIGQALSFAKTQEIEIPIKVTDTSLGKEELGLFTKRSENILGRSLAFTFENQVFTINDQQILGLLDPKSGYNNVKVAQLSRDFGKKINRDPQNPVFVVEEGKVKEFKASLTGIRLKEKDLVNLIEEKLTALETSREKSLSINIPVELTEPEVTTSDINNLGINEVIGRGTSRFKGSIQSRIHNIKLAASRINGSLIEPGETFNFNNILGDVSQYTGYKQAFIIQDGRTVLGDGGGVCQVSTTLFRAALNAGLPIDERKAHSYRVSYYEQDSGPGLDATVFAPTANFKFTNNTPGYILIQAEVDTKNLTLVFELYGTKDGRISEVTKPRITNSTPPPPDLYQDDPTLPTGQVKQIDYKAWGARVSFDYKVTRGNETLFEKTFISNYKPWQAVFLKGTGPN